MCGSVVRVTFQAAPLILAREDGYNAAMRIRADIEVPDDALRALCQRFGVARLEVFGSSARGDFRAGSDVDLLVEFLPGERVGLLRLAGLQLELQALIGRKVDLVPRRGLKPLIRDEVLGEARALYAA